MRLSPALATRITDRVCEADLLLVVPLAFHRSFAEQFSTPKIFLTKCFIILGLAVWALQRIWSASRRPNSLPARLAVARLRRNGAGFLPVQPGSSVQSSGS